MKTIRLSNGSKMNAGGTISKIAFVERTKAASGYIEDIVMGDRVQPVFVRLTDADCFKLYKNNDWLLATINRIARDCVKAKPRILPKDKTQKITGRIKDRIKKVEDFLYDCNDNGEHFDTIREKVIRDLLIYNRCAIEKVNDRTGKLKEVYAQDPKYLYVLSDIHGNLPRKNTYKLQPRTTYSTVYFDFDEIIHIVHNPVSTSNFGIKTMDGIAQSVGADILRATHNSNFFINGAEASGIIGLEGMSNAELKKFREYWRDNFRGAKNSHKMAAVNVPVKYVKMAMTNRDLEFTQYGAELRTKIFSAYGMQPAVMGIAEDKAGKTIPEQIELYKDGALRPILDKESIYYTKHILYEGFGFTDLRFDFPSVDQKDLATQTSADVEELACGLKTINEIRAERGLPSVTWGDTPISNMPGGGQVDPKTGKLIPPSAQNNKRPVNQVKKKLNILEEYISCTKNKISALYKFVKEYDISEKTVMKNKFVSKSLFVNGKKFELKNFTFSEEVMKSDIYNLVVNATYPPVEYGDVRDHYIKSVSLKIRHMVLKNITKGITFNSLLEIDKILHEEMETDLYNEIF